MSVNFFIFALPRSGTSWLSLFLSSRDSYCYHEPTADFTPAAWAKEARSRNEKVVGAIDTGAYRFAHLVREAVPEARCYVLLRDPNDIDRSLRRAALGGMNVLEEYGYLRGLQLEPIFYRNFDNAHYLSDLWSLLIGSECDQGHLARFLELRIQRDARLFLAHRPNLIPHMRSMLS